MFGFDKLFRKAHGGQSPTVIDEPVASQIDDSLLRLDAIECVVEELSKKLEAVRRKVYRDEKHEGEGNGTPEVAVVVKTLSDYGPGESLPSDYLKQ